MKIFVTGGGGFLGQAIVRQLLARGETVISYSRQPYSALKAWGVEHRQGDLSEPHHLTAAMKDCDAVMHVAAKAGVWGDYQDFYRANVVGTQNVLDACRYLGIQRLVYTSTPSVVHPGDSGIEGADESLPYPTHFDAPYPQTKAEAEQKVLAANHANLSTVALRPHLIWGPGDPHFVPRLVARARAGRLRLVGHTDPLIDTVYVDNAAEAHLLALDRLQPGSAIAGKAYFITQDEPLPISAFVNAILEAAGLPPVKRRLPVSVAHLLGAAMESAWQRLPLPGEPLLTRFMVHQLSTPHWFDISAARRELDYTPRVSFKEGMQQLQQALQSERKIT